MQDNKKYEICIGVQPYFPKSIFVKTWISFEADEKIKGEIENYNKDKNGSLVLQHDKIRNIEYSGLNWFFKIFARKLGNLEIKLNRITEILYIKDIEGSITL